MEYTTEMTSAPFDALALNTPPRTAVPRPSRGPIGARIVRLVWLTAQLVRRSPVNYEDYWRRFGLTVRTFRRDIAALRDAGMYINAEPHDYRMTCFVSDIDAA